MAVRLVKKIVFIFVIYWLCFDNAGSAGIDLLQRFRRKSVEAAQGLYKPEDKMTILVKDNFNDMVFDKPHGWLIEFYNSWCGYCQNFAPTWKDFAANVYEWRNIVRIGAIDCANDQNNDVCREMDILAYPTIKYFHENYKQGPQNTGRNLKRVHLVSQLTELLLDELRADQENDMGKSWPNLALHNFSNAAEIWDDMESNIKIVFLIFETPQMTTASEIILDLYNIADVKIFRVSNSNNLAKVLSVNTFPSLYAVDKYSYNPHLISTENIKLEIEKLILKYIFLKNISIPKNQYLMIFPETSTKTITGNTTKNISVTGLSNVVYQNDLESGLKYTITHEITKSRLIAGEELIALKKYLNILVKYFPFKANGRIFVTKLLEEVNKENKILFGKDLAKLISDLEKEYEPIYSTSLEWVGCKGSLPNYRGFTCSLWLIFHTLTVSATNKSAADAPEVLRAMLGYVKHFFGCTDCSQHFQSMASKNRLESIAENDGTILWLWMAHNEVNHRLAGDETEDPQHPKKQFPSAEDCPKCRDSVGNWNIKEVLIFLKSMYAENSIVTNRTVLKNTRASLKSYSTLYSFDTTIIFLLYLYCFIMICFIMHLFFSKRNYKKKPYPHDLFGKI